MSNRTRATSVVIGLASLAALGACGSSQAAPASTAGPSVAGQVHDVQTNAAVPAAAVVFADPSNTTSITALGQSTTDASGSYQLSIAAGHYAVYVDRVYGGQVVVRPGANRDDLLVHQNGCIARYGTIADRTTGQALAGATVSLLGVSAVSGIDGAYRLDYGCRSGLWSGSIAISVVRSGYQDGSVPMGRGEGFDSVLRQDVDLDAR
jgi:hypothetical protein